MSTLQSNTIQTQFDQHQQWCVSFARRLTNLAEWLEKNGLADPTVYAEVNRLRYQLSSQQVMVAVIAEFSRGKSELINALFFAHYGRRIMPAGAGRTTMCPAEMSWNPALPVGIRLLPIETRKEKISIAHWRIKPDAWVSFGFDTHESAAMAQTISKVGEVKRVSIAEATKLGFWLPDLPSGERNPDNPVPDRMGQVEVPVWRHACINIPHPLLKQGLVILDTPGLNAVGVEPDLTMALLGQAQATLFILGADTGVTKSDLDLWREHLNHVAASHIPRYAILNKIDTLWDDLKSPAEINAELEKQCQSTAELLSVNRQSVVAISAQKGLLAKIQNNPELLVRSNLPELEAILGGHLVRQRQTIIQQNCMSGMLRLQNTAARTLERRYQSFAQQKAELQEAAGKSAQGIHSMQERIAQERNAVESAGAEFAALQELCLAGLNRALMPISMSNLKAQMQSMGKSFEGGVMSMGLKASYEENFERLSYYLKMCETALHQVHGDMFQKIKNINTLHGFAIALVAAPKLSNFADKLLNIKLSHLHHLEISNRWRLMSKDYLQRVLQTLSMQVRVIFESAQIEIERWAQNTVQVLETELTERKQNLAKRIESVSAVDQSSQSFTLRIAQVDAELEAIKAQGRRLVALSKGVDGEANAAAQQGLGFPPARE